MSAHEINNLKLQIKKMEEDLAVLKSKLKDTEIDASSDGDPEKKLNTEQPGIIGVFDGSHMLTQEGQRFEVNPNYAAKSRLVYGDVLKMTEDGGRNLFKQVDKVARKEAVGVLNKKEGEWYFMADSGSYAISSVAAEHNNAEVNDEAVALLPDDNPHAPFAALDRVLKATDGDIDEPTIKNTKSIDLNVNEKKDGEISLSKSNNSSNDSNASEIQVTKDSKPKNKKAKKKKTTSKGSSDSGTNKSLDNKSEEKAKTNHDEHEKTDHESNESTLRLITDDDLR